MTDATLTEQLAVNKWTRASAKKLIVADCRGLFGLIFNDFGDQHTIEDPNGEQCLDVFIEHIDKASGDVTCLEDTRHGFQDGDYVTFSEVKGMTDLNGCAPRKVRVISNFCLKNYFRSNFKTTRLNLDPVKFNIGDLTGMADYVEGGKAKQVKVPFNVSFVSFFDCRSCEMGKSLNRPSSFFS